MTWWPARFCLNQGNDAPRSGRWGPRDNERRDSCPLMGNYGAADAGIPVGDVRKLEEALKQNNKRSMPFIERGLTTMSRRRRTPGAGRSVGWRLT
jgi:hypothetical protein